MKYKVVEVKWSRDGDFVGAPPISNKQWQLTKVLSKFADGGWTVVDTHHGVDDTLRFSIITLVKGASEPDSPQAPEEFPLTKGLYVSRDGKSTSFLRFSADGRVMAATDEDPAATAPGAVPYLAWDDDESGEYSLTDGHIEFTTRPQGAIEYRGTVVSARELDLEFRSEITGQAARESYVFVKVKGLKHLG